MRASVVLLEVDRTAIICLAAFAMAFTWMHFWRYRGRSAVPLLWLTHWAALLLETAVLLLWDALRPPQPFFFRLLGVYALSVFSFLRYGTLILVAESLPIWTSQGRRVKFGVIVWCLGASLFLLLLTEKFVAPRTGEAIESYLGYFATLWFAARWVAMTAPRRSMYIAFLLFLYASMSVIFIARSGTLELFVLTYSFAVVVYGALLYAGYYTLLWVSSGHDVQYYEASTHPVPIPNTPAPSTLTRPAPTAALPTATVEIKLENFFGFLYLLWTYPSGRGAVMTLAALAVTLILAIIVVIFQR